MEISREVIEQMIAQVLEEKIGSLGSPKMMCIGRR